MQFSNTVIATLVSLAAYASAQGFYGTSGAVVDITSPADFKSKVAGASKTSVVEFYAPWCGHCKNLKADYTKAGKKVQNLVPFYAVNCDEASLQSVCSEYQVKGFPTIKSFRPAGKKGGKPQVEDYQGERTAKALSDYALAKIPNAASIVTARNVDKFLEADDPLKLVLIAKDSAKSGVPPLYKVLSTEYKGKVKFGFVPASQKIQDKFDGVQLADTSKSNLVFINNGEMELYKGEMKQEPISEYLKSKLKGSNKGSEESTGSTKSAKSTKSTESDAAEETTTTKAKPTHKRRLVEEKVRKVVPHDRRYNAGDDEDSETETSEETPVAADDAPEPTEAKEPAESAGDEKEELPKPTEAEEVGQDGGEQAEAMKETGSDGASTADEEPTDVEPETGTKKSAKTTTTRDASKTPEADDEEQDEPEPPVAAVDDTATAKPAKDEL